MAFGTPGLPGEGGTQHGWEHFCLWFYGNLIRAHFGALLGRWIEKRSDLDSK